jgi:predicted RNA-binding protein with PIN domain
MFVVKRDGTRCICEIASVKRTILVDGYNIIKRDPVLSGLERLGLQVAREALFSRLLSSYDLRGNDITVVFDGQGAGETTDRWGVLKIIYSRFGESADVVIARLAAASKDPSQMVGLSDDRAVRQSITQAGGQAAGSADRRAPRMADKQSSQDDEPREREKREKKGNPRRAKKRQRQGPETFHW